MFLASFAAPSSLQCSPSYKSCSCMFALLMDLKLWMLQCVSIMAFVASISSCILTLILSRSPMSCRVSMDE